jgi:hypothetical protein
MSAEILTSVAIGVGLSASGGFIIGGGAAATVQGGSVIARLASTKMTAGTGNAVVATGEHAAAFGTSIFSLFMPLVITAILIVLIFWLITRFGRGIFKRNPHH